MSSKVNKNSSNSAPETPTQEPTVTVPTMVYAFNQGIAYASSLASSAATLDQLRTHLAGLAADTQMLVDAIVRGEEAVVARVRAGLPPAATQASSPQQVAAQAAATAVGAP